MSIDDEVICYMNLCVFIVMEFCFVIVGMKVLYDLECVGDEVISIVKCVVKFVVELLLKLYVDILCMVNIVLEMLCDVLDCFFNSDEVKVLVVVCCDFEVDLINK